MPALSRAQILAANDRKPVEVDVPEWGGTVMLQVMSGQERESIEREWTSTSEKLIPFYKEKMLVRCISGADGEPLFSEEDLVALGAKNASTIDTLFKRAMRLNGFEKDSVEEAAKN